jgi:hypothetical protein
LDKDPNLGDDSSETIMDALSGSDTERNLAENGFVELQFFNETKFDPDDVLEPVIPVD